MQRDGKLQRPKNISKIPNWAGDSKPNQRRPKNGDPNLKFEPSAPTDPPPPPPLPVHFIGLFCLLPLLPSTHNHHGFATGLDRAPHHFQTEQRPRRSGMRLRLPLLDRGRALHPLPLFSPQLLRGCRRRRCHHRTHGRRFRPPRRAHRLLPLFLRWPRLLARPLPRIPSLPRAPDG